MKEWFVLIHLGEIISRHGTNKLVMDEKTKLQQLTFEGIIFTIKRTFLSMQRLDIIWLSNQVTLHSMEITIIYCYEKIT